MLTSCNIPGPLSTSENYHYSRAMMKSTDLIPSHQLACSHTFLAQDSIQGQILYLVLMAPLFLNRSSVFICIWWLERIWILASQLFFGKPHILGLYKVSSWLHSSSEFLAGVPRKWCYIRPSATYEDHMVLIPTNGGNVNCGPLVKVLAAWLRYWLLDFSTIKLLFLTL